MISKTPEPPYYAVIFTSVRTKTDEGYSQMADEMLDTAKGQPGFLGVDSAREAIGITVSYWKNLESVKNWKEHACHRVARESGRAKWYEMFTVRIAKVEKEYGFNLRES